MESIIISISCIIAGAVIGYLFFKSKNTSVMSQMAMLDNDNKRLVEEKEKQEASIQSLTQEVKLLTSERDKYEWEAQSLRKELEEAKNQTEIMVNAERERFQKILEDTKAQHEQTICQLKEANEKHHAEAMHEQQVRFDETIAKVTAEMKAATETMLKERQKDFADSSNETLGQIVNPLRETIDKMKQAMNDTTEKQTAMSSEMKVSIEHMMRQSEAAKMSADELARLFKHGTKMQGDWGETVLDEILQSQGLTKGVHYETQAVIRDAKGNVVKTEERSSMRPDIIMHLDQKREVIIDSKVSMSDYMDYVNAETEEERQRALKAHIESINKHVKELSEKDYAGYIQAPKVKMDYVIMFVPNTGALWTALNAQPDLWRKAMEKNVFIADEQTLFAALRIINLTWTQIAQAQNHEKVFKLANDMIDRVGQFVKRYQAIGKALESAQKAYDDGEKKLAPQGQSILVTANMLLKLGAKQSDKNPIPLVEEEAMLPSEPETSQEQ